MNETQKLRIHPEKLAYWYFRLNGFLTTVNFVVHPDRGRRQETDADILGVRFPYRAELLENPMLDDKIFSVDDKPYIVIAEVKTGRCRLNGPWTQPNRKNMQRVLRAIGAFPDERIDEVAESLYKSGVWDGENYFMSLFCVGVEESTQLKSEYPKVPQVTWNRVLEFVFDRFFAYRRQKAEHQQWDWTGRSLWSAFRKSSEDKSRFIESIEVSVMPNQRVKS